MKTAGVPGLSEAFFGFGATIVPALQESVTLTGFVLASVKFLWTVNVAEFSVFVIVHDAVPFAARATFVQAASLFV